MPLGIAISSASTTELTVIIRVGPMRSEIISATGRPVRYDSPMSPLRRSFVQLKY